LIFTNETGAEEVLKVVQRLIGEGRLSMLDIAVLVKYKDGRMTIRDTQDVDARHGALFGAISGGLIGLVGGPVGAMIGAVAGGTTGGVAAHAIDSGFPDDYLKELQANLQPASSALIVLTRPEWSERVIEALAPFGGRMIRHVLKEEMAAYLAAMATFDSDQTPATELPARLEAQIAAWQTEIEALTTKTTANGATEARTQLVNLRARQHLAQEKLHDLWTIEMQELTRQIEALRIKAKAMSSEAKAEIITQLKTTRAKRRAVREKLCAQIEARINGWQMEIEALKARLAEPELAAETTVNPRVAALQRFAGAFDDPTLPTTEAETKARLAALQALVETADVELQSLYETQIATWQASLIDLQAYAAIPDIANKAEVTEWIAELQNQVTTARAKLKAHLEAQINGWRVEIAELQTQVAAAEAIDKAKIDVQITALKTQIEALEAQAALAGSANKAKAAERIATLQAKVATAGAKLKLQN
jgi:uncharacterized membrane protein